jgi:hypothetical protein
MEGGHTIVKYQHSCRHFEGKVCLDQAKRSWIEASSVDVESSRAAVEFDMNLSRLVTGL